LASFILVIGALIADGGCRFSWLFRRIQVEWNAFVNSWQGVGPASDCSISITNAIFITIPNPIPIPSTHSSSHCRTQIRWWKVRFPLLGHAKFNSHKIPVIQHPTDGDEYATPLTDCFCLQNKLPQGALK